MNDFTRQPAFVDPAKSQPKIRNATLNVNWADGSSSLIVIKGHFNLKRGSSPEAEEEIRSLGREFDRPLRVPSGLTRHVILDGISEDDFNETIWLTAEQTAQINSTGTLTADKIKTGVTVTNEIDTTGRKFRKGDFLRIPARYNSIGMPHGKVAQVWQVTKDEVNGVTVQDRSGEFVKQFAVNSAVWAGSTKAADWDPRRGDFVTIPKGLNEEIFKVLGPVEFGKTRVGRADNLVAPIGFGRLDGPAVHLARPDGSTTWEWTENVKRVENVTVTKKAETWSV